MGDEEWFPPGEATMGSGEDEPPAPDATMLMGDEVLREEETRKLLDFLREHIVFCLEWNYIRKHNRSEREQTST